MNLNTNFLKKSKHKFDKYKDKSKNKKCCSKLYKEKVKKE